MQEFAELDNTLAPVMSLIGQLHAEPTLRKRLDEDRDWDAVLRAFNEINNNAYKTMRSVDWLPLLHCLVHFCYDQEESTIRGNASYGLCRFVERVAAEVASAESVVGTESMGTFTETDINGPLYNQLIHVVLPSVKRGFKSHELQVRAEFVSVLGRMVTLLPEDPHFYDMVPLLADGDDEASFFSNIYHVQTHRRTRALRRLAEIVAARKEGMSMPTLTTILIPLIGHFAFETDRKSEQQLISDSISALGVMCGQLRWPQYWALIKSYFRLMALKPHLQKMLVRTVLAILDQFHWDLSAVDPAAVQQKQQSVSVVAAAPVVEFDGSNEDVDATAEDTVMEVDEETIMLITEERIFGVLIGKLLPGMPFTGVIVYIVQLLITRTRAFSFIHTDLFKLLSDHKEGESNMSIRVPIAIGYTKLLMRLPDTTMRIELPRLLTTVAQILRSRGQDVRDATRETLVKMAGILGPKYFQFVVKELAGALRSGYQLHVLGYSLHHLLVQVLPTMAVGDVDPCVDAVTEILLNDIFGEVGAEKDVDALAVKMKECKAKKVCKSVHL